MKILMPLKDTGTDPRKIAEQFEKFPEGTQVHIVYIIDKALMKKQKENVIYESMYMNVSKLGRFVEKKLNTLVKNYLDKLEGLFKGMGFDVKTSIKLGDPEEEIIKTQKDLDTDMTVTTCDALSFSRLAEKGPLMINIIQPQKKTETGNYLLTLGLGAASILWYSEIFTHLDLINRYIMAKQFYSGLLVLGILLTTVLIYGTTVAKLLKIIGLDTKSSHH